MIADFLELITDNFTEVSLPTRIELVPLPLAQPTTRPLFAPAESREFSAATFLLNHWHLASLDAPTVAATWTLAFAWVVHVPLPAWVPILIVLTVWSVYVGDRILDARSGLRADNPRRLQERHRFHWRYRRILLPLASLAAVAAACIIFSLMPVTARRRDSFLAAASLLYFTRVHTGRFASRLLSKEFLVGLLFTIGCVLPAFSRAASPLGLLAPGTFFILLAWLNCHAIERWESAARISDEAGCSRACPEPFEGSRIWDRGWRDEQNHVVALATLLALAGMALATALAFSQPRAAALTACAALSAILFALLDRLRSRIPAVPLRAAADLVLLTPVLLVPVAPFVR